MVRVVSADFKLAVSGELLVSLISRVSSSPLALKEPLRDTSDRQFWIKPWGQPYAQTGHALLAPQLEITFAEIIELR